MNRDEKTGVELFTFNLRIGGGGASGLIICEYLISLASVTSKERAF